MGPAGAQNMAFWQSVSAYTICQAPALFNWTEVRHDNEKLLIMAKFSLNCVQQKLFNKWDLVQTEFQQNGGKASLMDSKYIKLLLSLQDHA